MKQFILRDDLNHKAYSWPKTMLTYRLKMCPDSDDVLYMDDQAIPFQIEKQGNCCILKIIADLPTGGHHTFSWAKGDRLFSSLVNESLSNEYFNVYSNKNGGFIVVYKSGAKFFYSVKSINPFSRIDEEINGGPVEGVLTQTFYYESGAVYTISVKVKRELDYIEVYENAYGFENNEAELNVVWDGFLPNHRYSLDRGIEKIDAYLNSIGEFPFVLNPFMPRVSMQDQRYVGFIEKDKLWSGFLFHDLSNFDDKQYRIWGSGYTLAFHMFPDCIKAPIANGKRAFMHILCNDKKVETLGNHYLKYYSHVSLDNIKDWILDWEDDKHSYPKYFQIEDESKHNYFYFEKKGMPQPLDLIDILDEKSTLFANLDLIHPVDSRLFTFVWAPLFDLTASRMSDEEFRRVRAAMALICYVFSNENYYPTQNMLAGHPNFLVDIISPVGLFSALFGDKHPMHKKWLYYFEMNQARNMKYHVRPRVDVWNAEGGRWTESVGCYMFGMLYSSIFVSSVIYHLYGGEMPLLYPQFKKLLAFLVNIQTAPDEFGRRYYLPQGAHSGNNEFGGTFGLGYYLTMMQLADMCKYYEPLYAEYLLYNFRNDEDFFNVLYDKSILEGDSYRKFAKNDKGTSPYLTSCKYTGYGFVLRNHVNQPGEMMVFLSQIDDGPNYRWGRAGEGGCGQIFYYANDKKYSSHSSEAVGDENRGDVQSCTNFGVLIDHEFKSVGHNDLTEPLIDFGFVQYARVNAGKRSYPFYKYRSILMVENQYIAIYDAVADIKQFGRFSWSYPQNSRPQIYNLRPGVQGQIMDSGSAVDVFINFDIPSSNNEIIVYNGYGDFLTIVTHLNECNIQSAEYGADVCIDGRIDKIFNDDAYLSIHKGNMKFEGYIGYVSKDENERRLAIIRGKSIRIDGTSLSVPCDNNNAYAMSLTENLNYVYGKAYFDKAGEVEVKTSHKLLSKIWINGKSIDFKYSENAYHFVMPRGESVWSIGEFPKLSIPAIQKAVIRNGGCSILWNSLGEKVCYHIELSADHEITWNKIATVDTNSYNFDNLANGKYHIRIRGERGNEIGEYCHPFPIYVNDKRPHAPEGLRIRAKGDKFIVSWGKVLGVDKYRLYKIFNNKAELVYEGDNKEVEVTGGAYYVTCLNGNGESDRSLIRTSDEEIVYWDNHPEKGFERDTRSYEYGYPGFDFLKNAYKPILQYPQTEK